MTPQQAIKNIRAVLSDDLLSSKYKYIINVKKKDVTTGHCYIAAEALYHLIGGKKSGYKPRVARDGEDETHWWLEKDGHKLDPSKKQYTKIGEKPPYHLARACGFLTQKPSKIARIIMNRIAEMEK